MEPTETQLPATITQAEITSSDLDAAVKKAGVPIPKKGTVLLCTGHHERTFPTAKSRVSSNGSCL